MRGEGGAQDGRLCASSAAQAWACHMTKSGQLSCPSQGSPLRANSMPSPGLGTATAGHVLLHGQYHGRHAWVSRDVAYSRQQQG